MKKVLLASLLAIGFTTFAQEKRQKPDETRKERIEKIIKEYDLTPEQQTKLKTLFEQEKEKRQAHKSEMKKTLAKRKAERDDFDQQLKGILTEEQYKKYEAKRSERIERRKEMIAKHRK